MGYLDEEGYLYLTDRKNFMIITGGVNVYPAEIEGLLVNHEKVADVAVFGIPNEEFGEEVKAVVQLMNHGDASDEMAEDLLIWMRERLSSVKVPRSIDFMEQLPRMDNGKLHKRHLTPIRRRNQIIPDNYDPAPLGAYSNLRRKLLIEREVRPWHPGFRPRRWTLSPPQPAF